MDRVLPALNAHLGGLPRTFWYLWAGTVVTRLGSFVIPFMQIYLTSQRGLRIEQAALLISLYGVGSLFANPIGGALADRLGRRPTMIIGLSLSVAALLAIGFSRTVPELILAMALFGLVNDIYRPASMAVIADVVEPKDRLRAFTHLYWAFNLGAAIAPLVGGYFAREHFQELFIADAATTLVLLAIIALKVPETKPLAAPSAPRESPWRGFSAPFVDRAFLPFLFASFLLAVVFFQFLVSMPADMKSQGLSETHFGLAVSLNGLLIIAIQPFVTGRLAQRRRAAVLAAAALLIGVGYGSYAFAARALWVWLLGVVLWTAGEIIMAPVNSAIVADLSPVDRRGRYQGAYAMSWSMAWVVAPAVSGLGLARLGRTWLWLLVFGMGVVVAALQLAIGPLRRRRMQELHPERAATD